MTAPRLTSRSPYRNEKAGRGRGCGGVVAVVLTLVLVVTLTFWAISMIDSASPSRTRVPVSADIPPDAAEAPPVVDVHGAGRTSELLADWAEPIAEATGVDPQAIRAYGNAELIAREAWPECNLHWNTLAGIGWVETRHGTYTGKMFEGAQLDAAGVAGPPIIGPALNGSDGFAQIEDTDGGEYDNDLEFDRAIGPMQFIPESWARFGRDANGDGYADPQQIDDAALGAAHLLCSAGRDLGTAEDWQDAVLGYNHSNDYVMRVRDAAANYALNQPAHR